MPMDKYVGKRLDGRYEIQELIGVGGMAMVYKAFDSIESKVVAVKILKEEYLQNEEFRRRFKNESKAIALLTHPNIVKVYDVSFGDVLQYIVMEYIDGITLKQYIERKGPLSYQEAIHFTSQLLKALQHAHNKGIVHRDVKPQNIMLLKDGNIKVTDFGIARFSHSSQRTITDKAIGSVHYISPEQARGDWTDEKADIYSVGVLLYEMLTGRLPFVADSAVSVAIMQMQSEPEPLRSINPSIPVGLEQITLHAMEKDPLHRYASAGEMLADLDVFRKNPSATFVFPAYEDDSPTRALPLNVRDETPLKAAEPVAPPPEDNDYRPAPVGPILAGIAAAFIVVIGVVAYFAYGLIMRPPAADVDCPNLVGLQWQDVQNNSEYTANFTIVAGGVDSSQQYPEGQITNQVPAYYPGEKLKKGATITIQYSAGPLDVSVPDVYGQDSLTAQNNLQNAGFQVKTQNAYSPTVPQGSVIQTDPARGTSAAQGSTVTMQISNGPQPNIVTVPQLIGFTESYAESTLTSIGLTVGNETHKNDTSPAGTVIDQSPSANAQVNAGTAVSLTISDGPSASSAPAASTMTITANLPTGATKLVTVVVVVDNSAQSNPIQVDLSQQHTFSFTVSSQNANATAEILLDNTVWQTFSIDFQNNSFELTNQYPMPSDFYPASGTQ